MGFSVREQVWWVVAVIIILGFNDGSEACLEEEREALLKLKEAFNHPNSTFLPSWNNLTRSDCCSWEGISCDNSTQRVISLLLDYVRAQEFEDINWTLNASYFLPFHHLQVLDLSGNYLSGLFGEIRWDNLQTLYLEDNKLTEMPFFDNVSDSRNVKTSKLTLNSSEAGLSESHTSLTSLRILSLYNNSLSGSLPQQGGLCNLKNLKMLSLGRNKFKGLLPSCLSNLTSLRAIDLQYNGFEGSFPSSLFHSLKSLRFISLEENSFTGIASFSLFTNHSNLQLFSISCSNNPNLKLETENPQFLPSFQLKIFRIVKCTMNEASNHRTIPSFLHHQYDLRVLELARLNISGSFPHWLFTNNTKLNSLSFNYNFLTGPFELNHTSRLLDMQHFEVSANPINDEIPPHIGTVFPNLLSLNMSSSSLQGGFPASLGHMRQLNSLDLSNNNLSGYFPQEFGKGINDLRFLRLSNNNLTGPCLPIGSNFTHLLSVDLSNNSFKGKVPNGIINSSELRMLDLSANQLYGEMPSWIGNFKHLGLLILSQNSLAGPIPESFCNLVELKYLDLSQNRFNGTLPSCLNMPSLRYLHLRGNYFLGPVPFVLAKSPLLLTLDLTTNRFSSQIPRWLKSMSNLRVLLLKGNELEGSIPLDVCNLKNISILDLSQNKLSGGIPYCLDNITFRRTDAMAGTTIGKYFVPWTTKGPIFVFNYSSGELDQKESIRNFTWYEEQEVNFMSKSRYESYEGNVLELMSGLDLSDNQLTGEIPLQIGYLNTVHALNLSNNYLTGSIPETFSDLNQIESLDLSYNKLTGHIPPQLTQLYSLSAFSVAHNNLSGRVPDWKNQFSTFDPTCYEGNPFLCGPPLQHNCSSIDKLVGRHIHPFHSKEDDFQEVFLWSFGGAFVVFFLGVVIFLYFNSYFYIYK
ncbi:receptor-like protein 15 [Prosopis cineraria]|uniref:receptor-like protein 15 n=1 Tax=Prosopis cineraria TaxID=364024 RepID=UPI00240F4069|nr:receptor-like protein 15 [Prosopis cineraria]